MHMHMCLVRMANAFQKPGGWVRVGACLAMQVVVKLFEHFDRDGDDSIDESALSSAHTPACSPCRAPRPLGAPHSM